MKKMLFLAATLFAAMAINAEVKMWNVEDWDTSTFIMSGDSIIASFTVDGLTVTAGDTKDDNNKYNAFVMIDGNNKTWTGADEEIKFTKRLKLGGAGKANARTISFPVSNGAFIEVWAMSSSSGDSNIRDLNFDTEFGTTVKTVKVGGDALEYITYKYSGDATSLMIYSVAKGLNVYAIRVKTGSDVPTAVENLEIAPKAVKVVENGQVVIIRDGVRYNTLGAQL